MAAIPLYADSPEKLQPIDFHLLDPVVRIMLPGDTVITTTYETVFPYRNVIGPRSVEGKYTQQYFHTYTYFGGGLGCLQGHLWCIEGIRDGKKVCLWSR